ICGALLARAGLRERAPLFAMPQWLQRRRPRRAVATVLAGLVAYILFADALGFHITGVLILAVWMRALGASWRVTAVVAIFGTAVLIAAAPALAEVALKFSSFEYFWLVVLGLFSAVFLAHANPLKGIVSLLFGLLVSAIGLDNPAGFPRFTFGNAELAGGFTLIPIMIGMFAVSEIIRNIGSIDEPWEMAQTKIGNVFRGM